MAKRKGEKRLIVAPHRFSTEPRVHKLLYDRTNKDWFPACTLGTTWRKYHGETVDTVDLAVTCKKCGPSDGEAVHLYDVMQFPE